MRKRPDLLATGLCFVALSVPFSACGPKHAATELVIFPAPPDTARIQFLTRISSSRDVEGRSSFLRTIVGESETAKPINKPYGIAIHEGKIYVCDTGLGGIDIIDLEKHSFDYFEPGGLGQLKKPINCFVDKQDGWLYVADINRRQIVVFDATGSYIESFGELEGIRPTDVFVSGDRVWVADVADSKNGRIRVYDRATYRLVTSFPEPESEGPDRLYFPNNIFVTGDEVYVTDFGAFTIKIFSKEGEYLTSVGEYGRNLGQLFRPKGIAVDRESNLYVVDAAFQNVQIFDRQGRLLMPFGGGYRGPGYMWLPAKVIIDYDNLSYFQQYVHDDFELEYLILVTNQYGPDKVSVYGFIGPTGETPATN